MKGSVMMILMVCFYLNHYGQVKVDESRAVQIGQYCPDLVLKVENFPTQHLQLSKLKKKLVVIDFWSTWCKGCIMSFSKIDSMQREMGSEIEIILVTFQSKKTIDSFFNVRKKIKRPNVIMMTDDTLLLKLFPYFGLPHHVWLDANRKVVAITDGYNTTRSSIQQFLKEETIVLPEKKIGKRLRNEFSFLGNQDSSFLKSASFFSYLIKAVDSVKGNRLSSVNGSAKPNRYFTNHASINDLIFTAYRGSGRTSISQLNIFYEVDDISRYIQPRDHKIAAEWMEKNLYLYDLLVPPERADEFYDIMMSDMERYFNIEIKKEKRRLSCWVLEETDSLKRFATKGGKTEYSKKGGNNLRSMINVPFWIFTNVMTNMFNLSGKRFANSVEYSGNIDITLPADLIDGLDVNMLRQELGKTGLDIVEKDWLVEVLVVREKTGK